MNKICSPEVQETLNFEQLLIRIGMAYLCWFGQVSRIPQKIFTRQIRFVTLPEKETLASQELNDAQH